MTDWINGLSELAAAGESSVLITVAGVRGSAPREVGAKMIVTPTQTIGTIGGGQLEYQCVQIACRQLRSAERPAETTSTRRFVLGANCGQCCGGVVDVLFEFLAHSQTGWLSELRALYDSRRPFVLVTPIHDATRKTLLAEDQRIPCGGQDRCPEDIGARALDLLQTGMPALRLDDFLLEPVGRCRFHIAVFGAGHVGAATVDMLSRLDCRIRWIDSRRNILPRSCPGNVVPIGTDDPAREAAAMPPGSFFLIMTHSHPIDLAICDSVLRRDDFAYCGLIGSKSKRRRFERLLSAQGMPDHQLRKLVCPVGVPGIEGKKPAEIAVAVAAEVLQVRDSGMHKGAKPARLKALG